MKIILGSGSKWRADELRKAGIEFTQMSPDINEKMIRDTDPKKLTLAIARAKAKAILGTIHEPALVITADQVVMYEGAIREKPENKEEALEFISSYADHPAEVVNGIVVTNTETGKTVEAIDRSTVSYKPSLKDVALEVVEKSYAMTCAGALVTENPLMLAHEKERTGGDDSFNGLPIALVQKMLKEAEA